MTLKAHIDQYTIDQVKNEVAFGMINDYLSRNNQGHVDVNEPPEALEIDLPIKDLGSLTELNKKLLSPPFAAYMVINY